MGPDTLVVRPSGAGPEARSNRALALSEVMRLDQKMPRSRVRGAARGALWGVAIGAVTGAIIGAAYGPEPQGWAPTDTMAEAVLQGVIFLGVPGAGIGALVGAVVPGTRWEPVFEDGSTP